MKKIWIVATLCIVALFATLQFYIYLSRPTSNEELRTRVAGLPSITLTTLGGTTLQFKTDSSLVLIYFNSECDHCQREIVAIHSSMDLFKSSRLVFMSSQSLDEIKTFANGFDFASCANVAFVKIEHQELAEVFGTLAVPQIFVFGANGKLVSLFSGETKPEIIANALTR